ncbi:hypothetical protein NL676_039829 [Syzygium grande]|nr:hypothetical protein NL676_039829 [Syzygium grande]
MWQRPNKIKNPVRIKNLANIQKKKRRFKCTRKVLEALKAIVVDRTPWWAEVEQRQSAAASLSGFFTKEDLNLETPKTTALLILPSTWWCLELLGLLVEGLKMEDTDAKGVATLTCGRSSGPVLAMANDRPAEEEVMQNLNWSTLWIPSLKVWSSVSGHQRKVGRILLTYLAGKRLPAH